MDLGARILGMLVVGCAVAAIFALFGALLLRLSCYLFNVFVSAPTSPPPEGYTGYMPPPPNPGNPYYGGPVTAEAVTPASPIQPSAFADAPANRFADPPGINPYASPSAGGQAWYPNPQWANYPGDGVVFPALGWSFGVMYAIVLIAWAVGAVTAMAVFEMMIPGQRNAGPPIVPLLLFYAVPMATSAIALFFFIWIGLPTYWNRALMVTLLTGFLSFFGFMLLSFVVGIVMFAAGIR